MNVWTQFPSVSIHFSRGLKYTSLRLHLGSKYFAKKKRKQEHFSIQLFLPCIHLFLRAQVYISFVCRCSRSDRRAPKHVLRAYEARPIRKYALSQPEAVKWQSAIQRRVRSRTNQKRSVSTVSNNLENLSTTDPSTRFRDFSFLFHDNIS